MYVYGWHEGMWPKLIAMINFTLDDWIDDNFHSSVGPIQINGMKH